MLMDGIHVPLTTPFTRDGASFWQKLEYNVRRYSLGPAAGLVALTAANEGACLSEEEVQETLRVVSAAAAPEKVLTVAIARDSVRAALAIAEQAAGAGFDAVLLGAPPQWLRMTGRELLLYFQAVADGSPLPVMLWSDAGAGGCALSVEVIGRLARQERVIGIIDADLDIERYGALAAATREIKHEVTVTPVFAPVTRRMQASAVEGGLVTAESLAGGTAVATAPALQVGIKTRTRTVGFQAMSAGSAVGLVQLLEAGVAGAMPRLGACAPQGCYEACAAFKDGDPALAAEKEQRLVEADEAMRELGVAGVKYGCDWNGYYGGAPRLPRIALDADGRAKVERVLSGLRN